MSFLEKKSLLYLQGSQEIIVNINDLLEAAKIFSNNANQDKDKEILKKYFILKTCITEYEAMGGVIPLQVFNEHRMAFDHEMRSFLKDSSQNQIERRDAHIDRASLDIIKLLCAMLASRIKKTQKHYPKKALYLVNNGNYLREYLAKQQESEEMFIIAKKKELSNTNSMDNLVQAYLNAYIAHKNWYNYQKNNLPNCVYIYAHFAWIKSCGIFGAIGIALIANEIAQIFTKKDFVQVIIGSIKKLF